MVGNLACILSYGLMCTPETVEVVEAPPPDPLVAAASVDDEPGAKPSSPPKKGAASLLLAKVQSFYSGTTDLKAGFKQTYVHPVYGTKKVTKGTLKAKKPGLMVWDYAEADNADYWVEGKQLFVVERATKQVLKQTLTTSDVAGAEKFLFGGKELTEDFLVKLAGDSLEKRYGKPGHTSIRLKPKQNNPHYRELMLVVDDATGRVDAFVVLNQDKSTNHFELTGLKRNLGLATSEFKFKKPAGYRQIDNR